MQMQNVYVIAETIIQALQVDGEPTVTNLALNKLLYFAQGYCLARTGKPMFADPIEAWEHGPVVREVYQTYKAFYANPIILPQINDKPVFAGVECDVLLDVLSEYGKYSAWWLRDLSHRPGSPWDRTEKNGVISHDSMLEYFSLEENRIPSYSEAINHIPVTSVLPKEWYDPDEDELWQAFA